MSCADVGQSSISAIIIDADTAAAIWLAHRLAVLEVMLDGIADTLAGGLALLAVAPHLAFLAVEPGFEAAAFVVALQAAERGIGVALLSEPETDRSLDQLLLALPSAHRLIKPAAVDDIAPIIRAYSRRGRRPIASRL